MKKLILLWVCVLSFGVFGQGNGWEWQNPLPQGNTLRDIHVFDTLTAIAVGDFGSLLKSTNGGFNWRKLQVNESNELVSISILENHIWTAGFNGTLLHSSTGGEITTNKTIVSSPTFSLYPNPAEESFSLAGKRQVLQVNLVDGLGKEGPTNLPGGQANAIDIRSLKPGLYWVKIKTSTGVAVERLVKR
jgi:hypothetical protein